MAYEYGSIDLGIKNPFKVEGLIRSIQGLIITVLGLYCLLSVQNLVESGLKTEGWFTLSVGIYFMGSGLASLGWYQRLKNPPKSSVKNQPPTPVDVPIRHWC